MIGVGTPPGTRTLVIISGATAAVWGFGLAIVNRFNGAKYVTGHGARNYFGHELAESMGIAVEYIDYRKTPYPQLHGSFSPFVSILDLIANVGRGGLQYIHSTTLPWRTFLQNERAEAA